MYESLTSFGKSLFSPQGHNRVGDSFATLGEQSNHHLHNATILNRDQKTIFHSLSLEKELKVNRRLLKKPSDRAKMLNQPSVSLYGNADLNSGSHPAL